MRTHQGCDPSPSLRGASASPSWHCNLWHGASSPVEVRAVAFEGAEKPCEDIMNTPEIDTDLVLLEETPFLAALDLTTLFVVAPLNGVAHGRHAELCLFPKQ